MNQRVLTRQMKMKGYVVEVANHGREALDILLDAETAGPPAGFDVILMDIEMVDLFSPRSRSLGC